MLGTALTGPSVHTPGWVLQGCLLTCTHCPRSPFSSSTGDADCERHHPNQKATIASAKGKVKHQLSQQFPQALTLFRYPLAGKITGLEFAPSLVKQLLPDEVWIQSQL